MSSLRSQNLLFVATMVAALVLQLLPLPAGIAPLKPYWLALVLIYWAVETPDRVGIGIAFVLGLLGDIIAGNLLGEQALRLVALAFIVLRFRARLRFFPMWQQTAAVLALLLNDRVIVIMVRGLSSLPMPVPTHWISPLIGALIWPFLFILLDDLRSRLRARDG